MERILRAHGLELEVATQVDKDENGEIEPWIFDPKQP